ncbi:MAG: T9SS type A sorting domain-containing protein [Candidatus Krumholzibacteriota bacterium]|nr:T9SS type A sorting domain-containing protein [Candidatus Krumholzibacteriota bacterium]
MRRARRTSGATIHVPADQPTIAAGVGAAAPGDTVLVACGIYAEHDIAMTAGVTLRSETGEPECVTIDAGGQGRVILCEFVQDVVIEGFTIVNGFNDEVNGCGGALYCRDASLQVSRCVFRGNEAGYGGAVACYDASPEFSDCLFLDNRSVDGGGIHCLGSSPVLQRCTLAGNNAVFWGGGVFCEENLQGEPSGAELVCCCVYGNADGGYGGLIEDQTGINGNIAADPLFCAPYAGDFHLRTQSPCLPENNECGVLMGAWGEGCVTTGAQAPGAAPFRLAQNHPNPFNPRTDIRFDLTEAAAVSLTIHDVAGRCVRCLADGAGYGAGEHAVAWDGRDGAGRPLASGVYLCRLQVGSRSQVHKMVFVE